jgi:hypothetical protein
MKPCDGCRSKPRRLIRAVMKAELLARLLVTAVASIGLLLICLFGGVFAGWNPGTNCLLAYYPNCGVGPPDYQTCTDNTGTCTKDGMTYTYKSLWWQDKPVKHCITDPAYECFMPDNEPRPQGVCNTGSYRSNPDCTGVLPCDPIQNKVPTCPYGRPK